MHLHPVEAWCRHSEAQQLPITQPEREGRRRGRPTLMRRQASVPPHTTERWRQTFRVWPGQSASRRRRARRAVVLCQTFSGLAGTVGEPAGEGRRLVQDARLVLWHSCNMLPAT